MEVQPQLVLLQKTLLAIEGLGRQLYPDLDLWTTAKPFLEKWLSEQVGPKAVINQLKQNLPFFSEQLPHMPRLIFEVLELQKEQILIARDLSRTSAQHESPALQWRNIGLGALSVFLALGVLNYMHWFNMKDLTPITVIGTLVSGFVMLINRKERN